MRARIFLSAVSSEFAAEREALAIELQGMGYEVISQEVFETAQAGTTLLKWLKTNIDGCAGLIQLVGSKYGREPPEPPPDFPPGFEPQRMSYTQFEYFYACAKGKQVWIFESSAPAPEEGTAPADETEALQRQYREKLKRENRIRHKFASREELRLLARRTRHELERLRREWIRFKYGVLALQSASMALLLTAVLAYAFSRQVCEWSLVKDACKNFGWGGQTTFEHDDWVASGEHAFAQISTCAAINAFLGKYPGHSRASSARDLKETLREVQEQPVSSSVTLTNPQTKAEAQAECRKFVERHGHVPLDGDVVKGPKGELYVRTCTYLEKRVVNCKGEML